MNALTEPFRELLIGGISVQNWALSIAVALIAYLVMSLALRYAVSRMKAIAERTDNHVDDTLVEVLGDTNRVFLVLTAVLIGVGMLDLGGRWGTRVGQLWFLTLALQFGLWLNRAIGIALRRYVSRHTSAGMTQVSASSTLMSWALRTVLWVIVLLAILSNLGVNITAFVASLGVGGIAIALAVQNILGDLFASLSIAVDKPFEVGDAIGVGSISGTVQHIGLKTTRLRSTSGEEIVISNTDLLKQVVKNYRRMQERRIAFTFGLSYDTTPEQIEAVQRSVRQLIEAREALRLDRVHFQSFGESALTFEVVYFVTTPNYGLYMDEQQRLNLEMMRAFARLGVQFAFPSRTVYIASPPPQPTADDGDRRSAEPEVVTRSVPPAAVAGRGAEAAP